MSDIEVKSSPPESPVEEQEETRLAGRKRVSRNIIAECMCGKLMCFQARVVDPDGRDYSIKALSSR